jgi:hydrophobic/amphiphilic exporter-1 (mainly G- bacteria), HAE1 family
MKALVRWSVANSPAMNIIMLVVLGTGVWCVASLQREFWPYYDLDEIEVRVAYRGAGPEEVEQAICEKIEAAVSSISGLETIYSTATEGSGQVRLELHADVDKADVQRILGEVQAAVNQIPSFPALAEEPVIRQRVPKSTAIQVGIIGPDDDSIEAALRLRHIAENIRDELLAHPSMSQVELQGVPSFQIDVEVSEEALRKYRLSLSQVAGILREENLEMPGGTLRTGSQEILLVSSNRSSVGREIAEIPLTLPNGVVIELGELGTVRDEFSDDTSISRMNGRPAIAVSVNTTQTEDLLEVGRDVYAYLDTKQLPDGYSMVAYRDRSDDVQDRLSLMLKNGWQGLLLVFILLALFLEMRLAFWVAMGIPISLLGACVVMYFTGQTLNLTSLFAFLIALGIVVDDAIVVGENIYVHRSQGKSFRQAAIDGTLEVMPSVVTSVITTVIAFLPMLFVTGRLGRFTTVLPLAVIAMLLISLGECLTILPSHLAHRDNMFLSFMSWLLTPVRFVGSLFEWMNQRVGRFLDAFIDSVYIPSLRWSLRNSAIVVTLAVGLLVVSAGVVRSGKVPFVVLPRIDSNVLMLMIAYPNGTPATVTDTATQRLEAALAKVNGQTIDESLTDREEGVVIAMHRAVGHGASSTGEVSSGSHVGSITVSLIDSGFRQISAQELVSRWRKAAGDFPGTEVLYFSTGPRGPAAAPIEFSLLAASEDLDRLNAAVERCTERLAEYPGVFDITAGSRPGKFEYRLKIKDAARQLGVTLGEVSRTVRAAYYGEEAMRLQRGRHEVELRVRYPREQRRSLSDFRQLRHRTSDGIERPLTELVDIEVGRSASIIRRIDQKRSITISADVDEDSANAFDISRDLQANFLAELQAEFSEITIRWGGQRQQTNESMLSMLYGFVFVIVGMYLLLTIEFKSYIQPLLVLVIIPFGCIGAIAGHLVMGLSLTLFSIYGLVALAGIVVNDSIVLIDFINRRIADGLPLEDALLEAGRRRFRPVILTSVTTIAGMLPILLETARQALVLIPMATSLAFGLMLATVLVLILAPTFYFVSWRLTSEIPSHETVNQATATEHALA